MNEVTLFTASVNPEHYDLTEISKLDFDGAVEFFKNDTSGYSTCHTLKINVFRRNEGKFFGDGANMGDGSDALFVWYKVTID